MLQIGSRLYQPVPVQSGLHVSLDPIGHEIFSQAWRLEVHFVPADEDYGAWGTVGWEHWCFHIRPLGFVKMKDWRELARGSFFEGEETEIGIGFPGMENLINPRYGGGQRIEMPLGEFSILRREGYLFTIEADGEAQPDQDCGKDAPRGEFRMLVEVPFASATVEVPLNAGDPLATAKAIAARAIQLTESARADVRLFDPERKHWKPHKAGKHTVTLETCWRG